MHHPPEQLRRLERFQQANPTWFIIYVPTHGRYEAVCGEPNVIITDPSLDALLDRAEKVVRKADAQ